MLTITVAQDGSGDFASVSEAVLAVPYACAAEIRIGPGVYREKLVCEKQDITLIGAGILAALPKIKALWNAVLALLHDRIYSECYRFIELGYVTQDGLRNLGYLYKTYHVMGGNGTGTELYNRAKALPIHNA